MTAKPPGKSIIIAGYGRLGQQLARLCHANDTITAISRQAKPQGPRIKARLSQQLADLRHVTYNPAEACHFFFMPSPDARTEQSYLAVYRDALAHALAQLTSTQCTHFYLITSTAVYGENNGGWVDESNQNMSQSFNGQILLAAEKMLAQTALNYSICRLGGLYQGRPKTSSTHLAENRYINRIHLHDAAGFLHFLMHNPQRETLFNVVDDLPCSRQQVLAWLSDQPQAHGLAEPPTIEAGPQYGKRCCNQRLKQTGFTLDYPSYRQGMQKKLC